MPFIVITIILLIGLGIFISGIKALKKGNQSKSWPQIDVQIIESNIIEKDKESGARKYKTYEPNIRFKFQYHDKEYICKAERFNKINCNSHSSLEPLIQKYPIGSTPKAYISPLNPDESELECGVNESDRMTIAIGILFLGFGLVGIIRYAL